jgi:hypothetical protein
LKILHHLVPGSFFSVLVRRKILPILGAYLLLTPFSGAIAQNEELWLTYNLQARFNAKWEGLFDANQRWGDFGQFNAAQAAVRIGAGRHFSAKFSAAGGYAWFGTYYEEKDNYFLDENRLWEQALWRIPRKELLFWHRIRTEQRFREFSSGSQRETEFSFRFRYMFGALFPLTRPKAGKVFSISAQSALEIMFHAGGRIGHDYFDQNRLIAGFNWQLARSLSLATLYQYTLRYSIPQDKAPNVHVFRVTLNHQLDFRKKSG